LKYKFLRAAIEEALKASKEKEVPVGTVITLNGRIIARAHNQIESNHDSTSHAEIIAIRKAGRILKNWRLTGATMYVTMEPCPMCKNAIIQSRISKVFFGCKAGAVNRRSSKVKYNGPLMQKECGGIVKKFFKQMRQGG
jgi:tRNA(adenine34) deaminase